jgi:hypothetical protein
MQSTIRVYEVRPRRDKRGVDLISDALPFGGLWYGEPNAVSNAIGYAMHRSRSHETVRLTRRCSEPRASSPNYRFKFQKRGQYFIRTLQHRRALTTTHSASPRNHA